VVALKLPARYQNNEHLLNIEYFEIRNNSLKAKVVYLCRRSRGEKGIIRMEMVYVMAGEIWYFRLILLNRPIISVKDAYSGPGPDIQQYKSFQEAALAYGYIKDGDEALKCFRQVSCNFILYNLTI
jgi:hypothetical protein